MDAVKAAADLLRGLGQRVSGAIAHNGTPWLITPEAFAERLNAYLGEGWPAPPYSGDQVATLALCLEMAQEAAADA